MTPAVSVVMPVRNPHPQHFPAAVRSVLAQTMPDFELLVVEDVGERPAAGDLAGFDDPRIRHLVHDGPGSMAAARNRGLEAARAGLVAMFDGDDLCEPHRLERQLEALHAAPDIAVVGAQLRVIDDAGSVTGGRLYPTAPEAIAWSLRRFNALAHPSVMLRRDVVRDAGGYRDRVCEDYDLWCRLVLAGARLANLDAPLVSYRIHAGATKSLRLRETLRDTIAIKREHFRGRLGWRGWLRILGERGLLLLPPPLVLRLFDRLCLRGG